MMIILLSVPSYAKKRRPKKRRKPPKVEKTESKTKVIIKEIIEANFAISYDVFTKSFRSHTLQLAEYQTNYFIPHPTGIQMKLSRDDLFMKIGLSFPSAISYDTRGRSVSYGVFESRTSYNYFSVGIFYQKRDSFYYGFDFVKANFLQEITYSRYLYYQDPFYEGPGTVDLKTEIRRWNIVGGWSAKPTNIGIEFGFNIATKIKSVKQYGLAFPPNLYSVDFPVAYMRINLWL